MNTYLLTSDSGRDTDRKSCVTKLRAICISVVAVLCRLPGAHLMRRVLINTSHKKDAKVGVRRSRWSMGSYYRYYNPDECEIRLVCDRGAGTGSHTACVSVSDNLGPLHRSLLGATTGMCAPWKDAYSPHARYTVVYRVFLDVVAP